MSVAMVRTITVPMAAHKNNIQMDSRARASVRILQSLLMRPRRFRQIRRVGSAWRAL